MIQSRRRLLLGLGGTLAAAAAPTVLGATVRTPATTLSLGTADLRRVRVHNLHTGDKLDAVYFEKGAYVRDALAEAMRVMRDWRNGQEHVMDPRLFDALDAIAGKLETRTPFQIISGYRSPATNAMLHERSHGVASQSQHLLGKASDVRVEGVDLRHLQRAALSLGAGGVGYYPASNFVHVDVGPVRQWTGS